MADFDCDGDLDVFTAQMHGRPGQRVAVVENVDGKAAKWQPHILSNCGTHNAKVADIDGNGSPDIVGKNYDDDKRPRIWLNPNNPKRSLNQWRGHPKAKRAEKVARTAIARTRYKLALRAGGQDELYDLPHIVVRLTQFFEFLFVSCYRHCCRRKSR